MLVLLMALACGGEEEVVPNGGEGGPTSEIGPGGEPPPGGAGGNAQGTPNQGQQLGGSENRPKPPTFIYNAQSEGKGPLYKAEDGTCFVRTNWDQPPNGEMGQTEVIECPSQMSQEGWKNCVGGRLVRHNTGEKEGTCECEPIEGAGPVSVNCL
jgi:hypothetical protein